MNNSQPPAIVIVLTPQGAQMRSPLPPPQTIKVLAAMIQSVVEQIERDAPKVLQAAPVIQFPPPPA